MKEAAQIITAILNELQLEARPGVNLLEIEAKAKKLLKKHGVKSFNKGYKPDWAPSPYPAITCLCVNNEITHGIPRDYVLVEGDTVSIDLSIVTPKGYCGDAGLTVGVGKIENKKGRLLYYTHKVLMEAINRYFYPGVGTEQIAYFIKYEAKKYGYNVNRRFAGHRIGKKMHLKPNIYNVDEPSYQYANLEKGKVYCIEPFFTPGRDDLGITKNGWTWETADGQPSAFFEHMVLVTDKGPVILTDHIKQPTW